MVPVPVFVTLTEAEAGLTPVPCVALKERDDLDKVSTGLVVNWFLALLRGFGAAKSCAPQSAVAAAAIRPAVRSRRESAPPNLDVHLFSDNEPAPQKEATSARGRSLSPARRGPNRVRLTPTTNNNLLDGCR
jgi:hypothetical protein